ncbi:MAG: heme o synthase [Candidatus Dormibacteraeota bacterium]|nr:heme o synthase [Candidatus Dormibacteraeota bacterium]
MAEVAAGAKSRRALEVGGDYLGLLKLRVVLLLDLTALGAMLPAARGLPRIEPVLAVLLGGSMAAGGAQAINAWFDRDIDAVMARTRRRPLPSGRIPAWHALLLGIVLNVAAFVILALLANVVAALLALAGTLVYLFVYTFWLKRTTPQNIVIGGAAGAVPPLVGWAAVTGGLDWTAVSLFLVIFFWTPPHFWALARMMRRDYESARVPMLPVVAGERPAKVWALAYATLAVAASVVPFFTRAAGAIYLGGALLLGAGLLGACVLDLAGRSSAKRVFGLANVYLAALFALLAIGSVSL